jgi:hypothetical protein
MGEFQTASAGQDFSTARTRAVIRMPLNILQWMRSIEATLHPADIGRALRLALIQPI